MTGSRDVEETVDALYRVVEKNKKQRLAIMMTVFTCI
jgi:hypothetical protein